MKIFLRIVACYCMFSIFGHAAFSQNLEEPFYVVQNQPIDFSLMSADDFTSDIIIRNAITIYYKDGAKPDKIYCRMESKSAGIMGSRSVGIRPAERIGKDYLFPDRTPQILMEGLESSKAKWISLDVILKKQTSWIEAGSYPFQLIFSTQP